MNKKTNKIKFKNGKVIMTTKIIRKIHQVIPLPLKLFTPLAVVLATAGFICFTYQDLWAGFWFFAVAGIATTVSRALLLQFGSFFAFGPLREAAGHTIKFLLIFAYFAMDFETPGLDLGPWIALILFFSSIPEFAFWSNNIEEYIILVANRISYLIALSVPLFAMYTEHGAGYALVTLFGFSVLSTAYRLFAEFDAKHEVMHDLDSTPKA